ncbi:MAG: hypothetical protein WC423_24840 [Vulcanimicrobiota bacterium]
MSLEDRNYYSDPRVRGANDSRWFSSIDEQRMQAMVSLGEEERAVPFRWGVCPTCEGKGRHVNPSIDSGGIGGETFHEDPDFAEDYLRGVYDVPCYECAGRRVVPEIDLPEDDPMYKAYLRQIEDDAAYDAEVRMERMMGC